ncbi:MAG TPA: hypothetical protein VMO26_27125 [Vicinamibacterales bacterium]|nr:hypothetical protein [Vicinamibacterales bacterium]
MRTLVGSIGYRNLRDHSAPFEVLDELARTDLGPDVVIEDISYNPVAVVQWLESLDDAARFSRIVLVASVERAGRAPGVVTVREWDRVLPSDEAIQQAITEAVTGIIALDNTLVIAGYFRALPPHVSIVEIQPLEHSFGAELSAPVRQGVSRAVARIRDLTMTGEATA